MGFLSRQQLFMVFVIVTLVDLTTAFKEVHTRTKPITIGLVVVGLVVLFDLWVLWKLAWVTEAEKPAPSYAVSS